LIFLPFPFVPLPSSRENTQTKYAENREERDQQLRRQLLTGARHEPPGHVSHVRHRGHRRAPDALQLVEPLDRGPDREIVDVSVLQQFRTFPARRLQEGIHQVPRLCEGRLQRDDDRQGSREREVGHPSRLDHPIRLLADPLGRVGLRGQVLRVAPEDE
jgi:hypothetical protein